MRDTAIKAFAISACVGLAGCGGGGGSGGQVLPGDGSFDSLIVQSDQLATKLNTLGATTVMPTTDGATYNGVIIVFEDVFTSTEGVIGSSTLNANFATEVISGDSDNF